MVWLHDGSEVHVSFFFVLSPAAMMMMAGSKPDERPWKHSQRVECIEYMIPMIGKWTGKGLQTDNTA
jgi:hypothetical protein